MILGKLLGPIISSLFFITVEQFKMYLDYYNLKEKPFELSPGPRFLWLGEKHSEALALLKYGILENKGFLLLTGDVGVGKTALIHRLIQDIDSSTIIANIPDPGLDAFDFFNILASEFHMAKKFKSKGEFIVELKKFLRRTQSEQKNVLLIIDEAQRLNEEVLEQVRLLSNIEMSDRKLITIFFVGQPEFSKMLMDTRNRAVRQRIIISYRIDSLTEPETEQYIQHRLKVAGATRNIFEPDAIHEIYRFSRGCPRLVNIICDHALFSGYSSGLQSVSSDVIEVCEQGLRIPAGLKLKNTDVEQMPPESTQLPDLVTQPSRSKLGEPLVLVGIICLLGIAVGYFVFKSGLWPTASSDKQLYPPQQLAVESIKEKNPAQDEKINSVATADKTSAPDPQVQDAQIDQFYQKQESQSVEFQQNQIEINDQTMTISPGQSLSTTDDLSARSGIDSALSLPRDKSNTTASLDKMSDSEPISSLETAFQREGENAQIETKESRSEKLKRIIAEMEASQTRASPLEREGGVATSKKTIDDRKTVTIEDLPANAYSEIRSETSDVVKVKPPVTPPPAQTSDLSPPAVVTQSASPVLSEESSNQPVKEPPVEAGNKIARVETTLTDTVKATPPVSPPPAQTTDLPPPSWLRQSAGPVLSEESSNQPVKDSPVEADNKSATVESTATDSIKVKPPVSPSPVQTTDLSPPALVMQSAGPVLSKESSSQLEKEPPDEAGNKIAAVESTEPPEDEAVKVRLDDRLRSFLQNYCSTYAAKDLAKFTDFFGPGARENGKPFESLLPKYQKNFDQIETIQYRIELQQYTYDSQNETVRIEGNFLLKWLPSDNKWRENSGKIFMNLKDDGRSFLVQRLDYYGNRQTN